MYASVSATEAHRSGPAISTCPLGGEHPQMPPQFTNDIDPQANDARFVSEKPTGFVFERQLHGVSEMKMDAAKQQRCPISGGFENSHGNFCLGRKPERSRSRMNFNGVDRSIHSAAGYTVDW